MMHQQTLASLETVIVRLRRLGEGYLYEVSLLEAAQFSLMADEFGRDRQALLALTSSKEINSQLIVSELRRGFSADPAELNEKPMVST